MVKCRDSSLSFLIRGAEERPNAVALLERQRSWSFAEFYKETVCRAKWLIEKGVRRGDRVAIISDRNSECFLLLFAIWAAGGIAAPINKSLPAKQRNGILQKLRPSLCVLGETMIIKEEDFEYPSISIAREDTILSPEISSDEDLIMECEHPDKTAIILFTSGTTGLPKGAVISHRALAMNCRLTAAALGIVPEDRILINTPAYYTSAIVHLVTMFSKGASLATHQGFLFSKTFLELVQQYNCTGFGGAPAHFVRVFSDMEYRKKPGSLRFMVSSGDHLPVTIIERILSAFPDIRLYCVYGLTEVAGRLCILQPESLGQKKGSVGQPLPCMTVSTVSEVGLQTAPYEVGEVYVSGPMLISEYLNDEISSRDLNTPLGFKTGDFGYRDNDGFLYLQGRKDDIFKSGGEKVSAVLIQQELSGRPEFEDFAVIPMSDELMGAVPTVFYVPRRGAKIDRRCIMREMRNRVPHTHIPARFIEVAKIPRTGSGKVKKSELLESLRNKT